MTLPIRISVAAHALRVARSQGLSQTVFTQRFKDVGSSTVAFAANLPGAVVGVVVEYASLLAGYRALWIVAGVLYRCIFAFGRGHLREGTPAA